jgi:hypothetical protein
MSIITNRRVIVGIICAVVAVAVVLIAVFAVRPAMAERAAAEEAAAAEQARIEAEEEAARLKAIEEEEKARDYVIPPIIVDTPEQGATDGSQSADSQPSASNAADSGSGSGSAGSDNKAKSEQEQEKTDTADSGAGSKAKEEATTPNGTPKVEAEKEVPKSAYKRLTGPGWECPGCGGSLYEYAYKDKDGDTVREFYTTYTPDTCPLGHDCVGWSNWSM